MKSPPFRRVSVGGFRMGALERRYLARVIRSDRISCGPLSRSFERAFAREHGCRHAVFLNSGTSALHIALAALKEARGWRDGDEVAIPAVTFVATANVVLHNGLKPVFVDVDPLTYTMDPSRLEAAVTRRTRAVIPVHLMGLPADMDPILRTARRRGLAVVEDACEAAFASYKGRKVGSLGAVGCFSTYVAHTITTGVGGLAATNDERLAVRLQSLMNHGRDPAYLRAGDDRGVSKARLREIVRKRFSFVSLGHSLRLTEFEAALGLAQLERKDAILKARRRIAGLLTEGLKGLGDVLQLPSVPPGREHAWMLYPIVVREGGKAALVDFLEERGVETRDLMPLINQPVYTRLYGDLESRHPVARSLNRAGFYVGCHQYLAEADADYAVRQMKAFFGRR